jgi:hypothetical protein
MEVLAVAKELDNVRSKRESERQNVPSSEWVLPAGPVRGWDVLPLALSEEQLLLAFSTRMLLNAVVKLTLTCSASRSPSRSSHSQRDCFC